MIGPVHRTTVAVTPEFFWVGTLWRGLVLRAVWIDMRTATSGPVQVALVLSDSREASLDNLNAGVSLFQAGEGTGLVGVTVPVVVLGSSVAGVSYRLPFYSPVEVGSVHVLAALQSATIGDFVLGLEVETEREARPRGERGVAARRLDGVGGILEELRAEALAGVG